MRIGYKNQIISKIDWLIVTLLLMAFCAAIFMQRTDLMFGIHVSKTIYFAYFICALSIVFGIKVLVGDSLNNLKVTVLDLVLFVYFLLIELGVFQDSEKYLGSLRNIELICLLVAYIVFRQFNEEKERVFVWGLVTVGGIAALYGQLQMHGFVSSNHAIFRITGSFFNPGPFAGFLSVVFVTAITLFWNRKLNKNTGKEKQKLDKIGDYILGFSIIMMLTIVPFLKSRASWLAIVGGVLYLLACNKKLINGITTYISSIKTRILAITIALLIAALTFIGMYSIKKESADGRCLIWNASILMIKKNIVLGNGYNAFTEKYMDCQADYLKEKSAIISSLADDVIYPYNYLLKVFVENGLVGILIVFALLVLVFFRRIDLEAGTYRGIHIYRCGIGAIFIFGLFSYPEEIISIKFTLVFLLAMISKNNFRKYKLGRKKIFTLPVKIALVGGISVVSIFTLIRTNKLENEYRKWQSGFICYSNDNYSGALEFFQDCKKTLRYNSEFIVMYAKTLLMDRQFANAIQILEKSGNYISNSMYHTTLGDCYKAAGDYSLAEESYLRAARMLPGRLYPKYLLASLYYDTQQDLKAKNMAHEVLGMNPKIKSSAVKHIKLEMKEILRQYNQAEQSQ